MSQDEAFKAATVPPDRSNFRSKPSQNQIMDVIYDTNIEQNLS